MLKPIDGKLVISDDFGQAGTIYVESLHGFLIEDLDLLEEARIQRSLSNARGQAKYNERAKTDPVIRTMNRHQPSMLTPFSGGQFGNGERRPVNCFVAT